MIMGTMQASCLSAIYFAEKAIQENVPYCLMYYGIYLERVGLLVSSFLPLPVNFLWYHAEWDEETRYEIAGNQNLDSQKIKSIKRGQLRMSAPSRVYVSVSPAVSIFGSVAKAPITQRAASRSRL